MKWYLVLIFVILTGFILAIFQPFAYRLNSIDQLKVLFGFMAVAFFCSSFVVVLLPKIFRNFYNPDNWTVKKGIFNSVLLLLLSGLCAFIYDYFILGMHSPKEYWNREFFTILLIDLFAAITIGSIPLIITLFITQNKNLKKNLNQAVLLNKLLSDKIKSEKNLDSTISFYGDTKDSITIKPEDLIYIEASGNYVDICYKEETVIKHKLLRSTIKQMEEILKPNNIFLRCHRAYIININQIVNINGNAQGYRLDIKDISVKIPVSRTYLKKFRDILS